MFIFRIFQCLQKAKVEFAVCGGQALALHGAVRGTVDVDVIVRLSEGNLARAERVLTGELGLVSRIPVRAKEIFHFRKEFLAKRNLKAWSFVNPSRASEVVDIVITEDLKNVSVVFKEAWGLKIPVIAIPDLIRMKRAAGRPQDLADVEALTQLARKK